MNVRLPPVILTLLMEKTFLVLGAASGFLSVAAGAFGAHALKTRPSPEQLAWFETGARYQMFHALAMVASAWAAGRFPGAAAAASGWLFAAGTLLFSGSLYVMAFTGIRWLGAVTPIGGLAFLAGWAALALAAGRG